MKTFLKLLKIEGKLVLRSIDSIFFGVGMPVAIMLLIGFINGKKEAFDGAGYTMIQSSFGALITVGICATAFMAIPLTISDYRDKKILKHFFVTPVQPSMLLLVHVTLNAILSILSSTLVYFCAKLFFDYDMSGSILAFIFSYLLVMGAMYSLGMMLASICKSVKTANMVCSLVYFPMLFLSGATIPFEIFPNILQKIANVLPLTQGIKLLKNVSLGLQADSTLFSIGILVFFILCGGIISIKTFRFE
jgi:ABC-2 type transport system permease protein